MARQTRLTTKGNTVKKINLFQAGLVAASMTIATSAHAQEDVQIKVQKLSDTISVLFGNGGNIGVSAGPDGVFMIDDQYAPMSDKIRVAVAGLSDKPINYVINTHWHFDHVGGNENFGKTASIFIAQDNVRKRMVRGGLIKAFDKTVPPAPKVALPTITFNDTMALHLNGEEAEVFHVESAHTDGDSIIWFKGSNIVHMGDTFFYTIYPFVDHSSGGSLDGIIAAADKVLAFIDDKTQIIPGHGPVTDKAGLITYRDMCITMRGKISKMKEDGLSLEAVIAAKPTAEFDKVWNTFGDDWKIVFVTALYEEAK